MTVSYFLHVMPLWGVLTSILLLAWATYLGTQLFTTWRWATELRRWKTTRRRAFSAPQPRYYF
ncbi:hypothetical protein [Armatimonas sp.]|uniref:hypothetical protein n=1 Tax=Armatimonas sp. TaxID=1872638 RepID=UPI00286ADDB9|nr:hypothetical protein [Armatimonas sp.]